MKFIDLTGKRHNREIIEYKYYSDTPSKSIGQSSLGKKLRELFPLINIYTEVPCFGLGLYLDFFIPGINLAFEFDGRQHEEFIPHFHGDRAGYAQSVRNDVFKNQWCEINGVTLVRVNEKNIDNLKELINHATS